MGPTVHAAHWKNTLHWLAAAKPWGNGVDIFIAYNPRSDFSRFGLIALSSRACGGPGGLRGERRADPVDELREALRGQRLRQFHGGQIEDAGLPERCVTHGLRKAAARRLAEAGCSANEIAAITRHATLAEVSRYTKAADQKRLAKAAIGRLERSRSNTDSQTRPKGLELSGISQVFREHGGGVVEPRGIEPLTSAVRLHELE